MGLRIFRRVKVAPGITLNVSKSGLSTSIGPRGAKVTLGHGRVRRTVGLPGTGVFYTTTAELDSGKGVEPDSTGRRRPGGLRRWIVGGAVALIALTWVGSLGGGSGTPAPSLPAQQANAFVAASPQPNAATTPTASATPKATATATPKPTAKPSPKPTAKSTPRPAAMTVRITSVTSPAYRNSYASVTAETSARANCSIEVDYASGPSHAAGLGSKTSSSTGSVSWTWKIGGNTTKGSWPIYVTCSRSGQEATASTAFRVV